MRRTDLYTFFWKSKLGQWSLSPFRDNMGIQYNCAEQYMMAKKAQLFNDVESYNKIMLEMNPKVQQELGRTIKNFDQGLWDIHAQLIVYRGNHLRFSQNKEHRELLLETAPTILVEASPYDLVWGIGLAEDDLSADNKVNWRGKNLLGYTLTELRNEFFI